MGFSTHIPCDRLKPYVKAMVISENAEAASYKILPDTSIVMGFQYSGSLSYNNGDDVKPLSASGITGLRDTYRIFNNSKNIGSLLVIFSETGAAAFFNQPMHELFDLSISLNDLLLRSQMDVVSERLNDARTEKEKVKVVEEFLLSRLNPNHTDQLVNLAVSMIRQTSGTIRMALLAERLHISQGRLEKRFRRMVGASPKKFAAIVRLRTIVNRPKPANDLTGLALDSGYFDQAHFIKDFKAFTGDTPGDFFSNM